MKTDVRQLGYLNDMNKDTIGMIKSLVVYSPAVVGLDVGADEGLDVVGLDYGADMQ